MHGLGEGPQPGAVGLGRTWRLPTEADRLARRHLLDTGRHDRLGQRRHPDEADAVDTVGCVERHDRAPEPQPCGLGQPPLGVRHLADLTGEADLAPIGRALPGRTTLLQKPFDTLALAAPLIEAIRLARGGERA